MPIRVSLGAKIIFQFPPSLTRQVKEKTLRAFSQWIDVVYPKVIMAAPVYRGPDPRRGSGVTIKKHLKIVWTEMEGIRYKAIGVPGGSKFGTPAYRALMAIYAMHYGQGVPIVRLAQNARVLAFPVEEEVKRGRTRRREVRWIFTPRAIQRRPMKLNPFILETYYSETPRLISLLEEELGKRYSRKVIEVDVST